MAVVPLTTIILAWTNESHSLIWSDITVKSNNSLLFLILDHGAWFWTFTAYSYLLMLFGIALVFDAIFHSSRHYWAHGTALVVAALASWMTNWAFAVGLNPVTHLDLTPAAFAVSGLVLVWALIYAGFMDILPIARQLVIDSMTGGVIVLDAFGRVVDFNPAAKWIVPDLTAAVLGTPLKQIWPASQDFGEPSQTSVESYVEVELEGGQRRNFEVSILPITDGGNIHTGHLLLLNDVTERTRREEERQRLELIAIAQSKLATLGEVATGVAHEINQPLTYISTMIQSLEEELGLDDLDLERLEPRLAEARRQVGRISIIVDHLRTFGRQDDREMGELDLTAVLDNTLLLVGERLHHENVDLERRAEGELPRIWGNASQLEQVYLNLFQNSIDALSQTEGAKITITLTSSRGGEAVELNFSDNGVGISPAYVDKVFQPFFTTK